MLAFYLYIISAVVYIFAYQIKGVLYAPDEFTTNLRYKYDCMAYYLKDIQWFSFAFVMGTMSMYFMVSAQMQHASAQKDELKADGQSYKVVVMLMPTALIRLFMMIRMSNIRTAERRIETFSSAIWLSLVGSYAGIWALYGLLSV